ncbi:hypothetical protein COW46_04035 [Candidatus Gracilibacteria bacterium CG17_big_fil_post_rev_8_21_14_2_50_48_13]|nr:MAG: hypothetical protein COW46_04035 [Candidatus Gracilibacteria bacterium CG17_big_fil_post_rev_8_21_14_2_50_48_13]
MPINNSPENLSDSTKSSPEKNLDAGVLGAMNQGDQLERKFANIQGDLYAYVDTLFREKTPEEHVREDTRSELESLKNLIESQDA